MPKLEEEILQELFHAPKYGKGGEQPMALLVLSVERVFLA